ncbi:MAG: HAMP domain-containing histidine kinase, partial [Asticcacaulis sp.]|nr:HAMP domain-containing histidine kinase [Asticcacaulis sp.]
LTGEAGPPGLTAGLRVIVWHLGWAACQLAGLLGLLFLPANPLILLALLAMAIPGFAAITLVFRDSPPVRQGLVWLWSIFAAIAVTLTGGIAGPLAIWVAMPLAAAVVLNQRSLISLGAALSLMNALVAVMVSIGGGIHMPDDQEAFLLSLLSVLTFVLGVSIGLLPALRSRSERADDAEEARARLMKIVTEQPQLILAFDERGRVLSAYGEAPVGLDLNILMQHGLYGAAHPGDRQAVATAVETAVAQGRAEVGFAPHGAMDHYLYLSMRRASDDRLYGAIRDGSLQHAREAALEAARADAEALNQGKTRFLASMSHELRTPLNAVIGFSDIMRLKLFGDLPPKYSEYAQLIWESGQHVLDMINDVLDMSKIEAQRYELTLESFDIREPVSQALRLMRSAAHDKGVDIHSAMPAHALVVSADKRAVKQVALNLLSNAVKFTPKGGSVRLALTEHGDAVDISVTDTGIGIAPDDLSRIGQPYEQAGAPEQKAMGTGLGLSIVKAMAHMHGGQMTIRSDLGDGTEVVVRLPVRAGVTATAEPAPHAATIDPLKDHNETPEAFKDFGEFVIRPRP